MLSVFLIHEQVLTNSSVRILQDVSYKPMEFYVKTRKCRSDATEKVVKICERYGLLIIMLGLMACSSFLFLVNPSQVCTLFLWLAFYILHDLNSF